MNMTNFEATKWGRSLPVVRDVSTQDGKVITIAGVNYIDPKGLIPLHTHEGIKEEYIPQTDGLRIVVIPDDMVGMAEDELLEMLKRSEPIPVGEAVMCGNGFAHALYNDTDKEGACTFIKYQQ